MSSNDTLSNNSLCPVCGGDQNVVVISFEHDDRIVTHPFPKEIATKVKVTNGGMRRATRLDWTWLIFSGLQKEEMNDV